MFLVETWKDSDVVPERMFQETAIAEEHIDETRDLR